MNDLLLPRLRGDLDFMASPIADRPGLLIRDPYRYSDITAVIPPPLVEGLRFFNGESPELALREWLHRLTGQLDTVEIARHLHDSLSQAGFLEDATYAGMREARHREFAAGPERTPAHAGSAYPAEPAALGAAVDRWLGAAADGPDGPAEGLVGIAAPHVSLDGGWRSYAAAYRALDPGLKDRTFVILGTSHYGPGERFGLTRKPFVTPLGRTRTDAALVDRLERASGDAVLSEDYCHAIEHSIEFQVLFLQRLFGPDVTIVPILCGPFAEALTAGTAPERNEQVARFLGALGDLAARESARLFWVLGVDMAHVGRRYGDERAATAGAEELKAVEARDRERIAALAAGDAAGFWGRVAQGGDDLRWCGSAPLYTFLRCVPGVAGELARYEQWNIDEASVVSFAGIRFRSRAAEPAPPPSSPGGGR